MKSKILIIQSSPPNTPNWISECMNSVEMWCHEHDHDYLHVGNELFMFTLEYGDPFTRVQQSDLARLHLLEAHMSFGHYKAVYWLDSDFLIWNIYDFELPMPERFSVVCAREAHCTPHGTNILLNNSVLGFCDRIDARIMSDATADAMDAWQRAETPPHTIAGPEVLMARSFPLRKIIAKKAGCFSSISIDKILGPWLSGRKHLFWLSVANGASLSGANLCSSRERDDEKMLRFVQDLIHGDDMDIGMWAHFAGLYRAWLWTLNLPFRLRCCIQAQCSRIRNTLMPSP